MKRERFLGVGVVLLVIMFLFSFSFETTAAPKGKQQYYEIKVYRVNKSTQSERVDNYLRNSFIPALHKAGIADVGVFKPIESDTAYGKLIYVFIPYKSVKQYLKLPDILNKDKQYQESSSSFVSAPYNDPPFARYESILLEAFAGMPQFVAPTFDTPAGDRIYELRSYESATEYLASQKIKMFDEGEIALFEQLNFNPVFFAKAIAGKQMPNLMYMTSFRDMTTHDDRWKAFRAAPGWAELSAIEEYKNTVSKSHIMLLHPTSYSDF